MDVQVLGPLEATVDGRAVPLGGAKPRALLAMLALNAGSTVSTRAPDRGSVGRAAAGDGGEAGAGLRVPAAQGAGRGRGRRRDRHARARVRAAGRARRRRRGRFERLVARGAPREALALWRGPPLDDVADEPFAAAEIRRLEELRLAALELAIELDLAAGRHREVVGELEAPRASPSRCASGCTRSGCWRCIAPGGRPTRSRPTGRPGPRWSRRSASSRDRSCAGCTRRSCARTPRSTPPAAETVELPPELDAGDAAGGPRGGAGVAARAVAARARRRRPARADHGRARDRQDAAGGRAGRRGASRPRCRAVRLGCRRAGRGPGGAGGREGDTAADAAGARRRRARGKRGARRARRARRRAGRAAAARAGDGRGRRPHGRAARDATLCLEPLDADGGARRGAAVRGEARGGGRPGRSGSSRRAAASRSACTASPPSGRAPRRRSALGAAADRAAAERTGLRAAEDELAGDVVELQALRERAELRDGAPEVVACPFKGLASFDVDDADFFFGRERLVAEMVARLAGAPLMAIVGPSGSGKSSALRAGLLPALAAGVLPGSERWALALLRPGEHPLRALEQATADAAAARPAGRRRRPVRGGLHGLPRRGRASGVRRRARRVHARRAPARARARRRARRLLRPLRRLSRAGAPARRQPRPRRPDAPRRAAPRDRAAGASAPACASSPSWSTR